MARHGSIAPIPAKKYFNVKQEETIVEHVPTSVERSDWLQNEQLFPITVHAAEPPLHSGGPQSLHVLYSRALNRFLLPVEPTFEGSTEK